MVEDNIDSQGIATFVGLAYKFEQSEAHIAGEP